MTVKKEMRKIADILGKQQRVLTKLAQQVVDTSVPNSDPLGKIIHDATSAWAIQNKMSAKSSFEAGADGKNYEADVILNITDPRKPVGNTPAAQATLENFKRSFTALLQSTFAREAQNSLSPLFNSTARFNVTVR
jgi:hypothetical protein